MKIKEQTRKLAAGCSKHSFEVADKAEKKYLLDQLVACDGGTGVMHESFHVDDPTLYSREWFSWANMMFCELVLDYLDIR